MTKVTFVSLIKIFLITRVGLLAFTYFFYELTPINTSAIKANYVSVVSATKMGNLLIPWDGQWILDIAQNGYPKQTTSRIDSAKYVQMPLYPFLIRIISPLTFSYITSGLIINLAASFIGSVYLYKLLVKDYSAQISKTAVRLFLINPLSIFFLAIYNESLFFCLSILTFYFLREKKWLLTVVFAILTTVTKSTGILLSILLFFEILPNLKKNRYLFLIPIMPIITFMLYNLTMQGYSGQANLYVTGQQLFGRFDPSTVKIFTTLGNAITHFSQFPIHGIFYSKLDLITILIIFALTFIAFKLHIRLSYALYPLLIVLLTLSSGTTTAIMRYLAISFPIYLIVALLCQKRPHLDQAISYGFVLMQALFALLYTHWYWVA